jgi:hypothetical protein
MQLPESCGYPVSSRHSALPRRLVHICLNPISFIFHVSDLNRVRSTCFVEYAFYRVLHMCFQLVSMRHNLGRSCQRRQQSIGQGIMKEIDMLCIWGSGMFLGM